jgi:membrane-bound lytic murein transglycosylase D
MQTAGGAADEAAGTVDGELVLAADPHAGVNGTDVDKLLALPGSGPSPHADLWDRVRAGYGLGEHRHPRVERELRWFRRHPDYMERVSQRAEPFLYLIVDAIERRELPTELALLPIVESAYQPLAYSHGHASGLWQFIPSTGRLFGLEQNWWYDGRRDVYAATRAALDYLTSLNAKFGGDWLLTLAAYNCGESRVQRERDRNRAAGRPTDFWHLRLPSETRAYVPKLLAVARLVGDPERYGIKLKPIANEPRLRLVETGGQLDLTVAARLTGLTVDELALINPALKRRATPPTGPNHLLVPIERAADFQLRLARLPQDDRLRWHRHRIRSGENLSIIARRYGADVEVLQSVNGLASTRIIAGQTLMIPATGESLEHLAVGTPEIRRVSAAHRPQTRRSYTVRSGDSLWKIAARHGVSHTDLARWNGMSTQDPLPIGRKLVLFQRPKAQTHLTSASATTAPSRLVQRRVVYRVRKGDSLYRIARQFGVSVDALKRWNALHGDTLQPGQRLVLHLRTPRPDGV